MLENIPKFFAFSANILQPPHLCHHSLLCWFVASKANAKCRILFCKFIFSFFNMSVHTNWFLAISNILALPTIWYAGSLVHKCVTAVVFLASTLMHASERKHKLPGIWPFNMYSTLFLNIDRTLAFLAFVYLAYNNIYDVKLWSWGVFGFACLRISEICDGRKFLIFHTLWHVVVFYVFWLTK